MGMYTELIFEGLTKENIPHDIEKIMGYFFGDASLPTIVPEHPFFKTERWKQIGHTSSCNHFPLAFRYMEFWTIQNKYILFLRCDLKNYNTEIEQFMDWITPYMENIKGWIWYEESKRPLIINYGIED